MGAAAGVVDVVLSATSLPSIIFRFPLLLLLLLLLLFCGAPHGCVVICIYNTDVTRRQAEKTKKKKEQNLY